MAHAANHTCELHAFEQIVSPIDGRPTHGLLRVLQPFCLVSCAEDSVHTYSSTTCFWPTGKEVFLYWDLHWRSFETLTISSRAAGTSKL